MTVPSTATDPPAGGLRAALQAQAARYHDRHPFHVAMNSGRLTPGQIRLWAANRFYYQETIPRKDAAILANCPDREVRRRWITRITDHDGTAGGRQAAANDGGESDGGIEAWLRLAEAVGLDRRDVCDHRYLLPGVRFAVDAYLTFARTRPWIQAVASSLTELFAPDLMAARLVAFERYYPWIDPAGLCYFRARLQQAPRDADHALQVVLERCREPRDQQAAVAALAFKCEVLQEMLNATQHGDPAPLAWPAGESR